MNIGCSECVCIAIESHRPALLRSLLERPHTAFRDCYWSALPISTVTVPTYDEHVMVPELHHMDARADLSFVGRADCGHMRVDGELRAPLQFGRKAYILVSLVLMARWHSSAHFPALQMLLDSGKFDFREPQFFHLFHPPNRIVEGDNEDFRDESEAEMFADIFEEYGASSSLPFGISAQLFNLFQRNAGFSCGDEESDEESDESNESEESDSNGAPPFDLSAPLFQQLFGPQTRSAESETKSEEEASEQSESDLNTSIQSDDTTFSKHSSRSGGQRIAHIFEHSSLPGPLQTSKGWTLTYELETPRDLSDNVLTGQRSVHSKSGPTADATIATGVFKKHFSCFHRHNGRLACLLDDSFHEHWLCHMRFNERFIKWLNECLQAGADLNDYFISVHAFYNEKVVTGRILRQHYAMYYIHLSMTTLKSYEDPAEDVFFEFFLILLRNGFTCFLKDRDPKSQLRGSFIALLFTENYDDEGFKDARAISAQFMALGYGRRELHPTGAPLCDEHLDDTRRAIDEQIGCGRHEEVPRELQELVERFDAGPLTLQQLARIAVRRAVGGANFARRARSLASHLPPPLLEYVAESNELMRRSFDK